jgi:hypothetical protein
MSKGFYVAREVVQNDYPDLKIYFLIKDQQQFPVTSNFQDMTQ